MDSENVVKKKKKYFTSAEWGSIIDDAAQQGVDFYEWIDNEPSHTGISFVRIDEKIYLDFYHDGSSYYGREATLGEWALYKLTGKVPSE